MLLMLSMSSKVSLFGLFSSIDLSSGLVHVLLNLLLLLCFSLCHHQMWVSLFASSPTKDISPLLNSWNSWDINCFSSYICEVQCKFGTGCNKCMMSSSTGKTWWFFLEQLFSYYSSNVPRFFSVFEPAILMDISTNWELFIC